MADLHGSTKVSFTGTTNLIPVSSVDFWVESYTVEPHDSNAAKCYGGKSTLSVSGKVWLFWLPPPSTNFVESFSAKGPYHQSFNLKELYMSGDNGEGATVTYVLK